MTKYSNLIQTENSIGYEHELMCEHDLDNKKQSWKISISMTASLLSSSLILLAPTVFRIIHVIRDGRIVQSNVLKPNLAKPVEAVSPDQILFCWINTAIRDVIANSLTKMKRKRKRKRNERRR